MAIIIITNELNDVELLIQSSPLSKNAVVTCRYLCLARKNPSHVEVVDDVCWPAINKPIIIPAISSSLNWRPVLQPQVEVC